MKDCFNSVNLVILFIRTTKVHCVAIYPSCFTRKYHKMLQTEPIPPGTGSNADYTSSSVTLTFDASNTLECVRIPINDDDDLEPNEMFTVSLTTTEPDVILDPRNGEVIILNRDGQCLLLSPFASLPVLFFLFSIIFSLCFNFRFFCRCVCVCRSDDRVWIPDLLCRRERGTAGGVCGGDERWVPDPCQSHCQQ